MVRYRAALRSDRIGNVKSANNLPDFIPTVKTKTQWEKQKKPTKNCRQIAALSTYPFKTAS
tara:strand:+ start:182 stop:364 length:183 start_codon:yes stop_codon:yes gene_type:complete